MPLQIRWPATKKKLQNMPNLFSGKIIDDGEEKEPPENKIVLVTKLIQGAVSSIR